MKKNAASFGHGFQKPDNEISRRVQKERHFIHAIIKEAPGCACPDVFFQRKNLNLNAAVIKIGDLVDIKSGHTGKIPEQKRNFWKVSHFIYFFPAIKI